MSDVTCASGVDLLMDYLEGLLSARASTAIEAHLAICPRCVAFVASYRETPRILRDATEADVPAEASRALADFLRRVLERPSGG